MKTIEVKTGRSYQVKVGSGLLASLPEELRALYPAHTPRLAVVTDDRVNALYGDTVLNQLMSAGFHADRFVFAKGEASKTLATVERLYAFLSEQQITRTDLILALGGGVTGDLAGFAASSWLRGIEFIQLPTTLLAMVDSSVGGKTGVDLPQGKNLVGAFWQPSLVLCDLATLDTLESEQFADGMAEVIKYGAILDEPLFAALETADVREQLEEIVCRCIDWKRQVVERDERDRGERQWLNFGHTLGHAIERQSRFAVSHGQGVAIGMALMAQACERQGLTPPGTSSRIADCCTRHGLPATTDFPLAALCEQCAGDKKRAGDSLSLVTLEQLGKATLTRVRADQLLRFMEGNTYV